MAQNSKIIGVHGFLVLDGTAYTVPGAGTSDRTHKPGAADASWALGDLGIIEEIDIDHKQEEDKIFAPTPGIMRLYDVLTSKHEIDFTVTAAQLEPMFWQGLFGTAVLAAGTNVAFNQLGLSANQYGWLKLVGYDGNTDAMAFTLDQYVQWKVDGAIKLDTKAIRPKFMFQGLHSIYNMGNLNLI